VLFFTTDVITLTDSKAMMGKFVKYSESHQSMTRAAIQYSVTEICRNLLDKWHSLHAV